MVLPLTLLSSGREEEILVEMKNGDTVSGVLVNHDHHMNMELKNVIRTNGEGSRFWRLASVFVRGSSIKLIRFNDSTVTKAKREASKVPSRGGGTTPISSIRGGRGAPRGRGAASSSSINSTRGRR